MRQFTGVSDEHVLPEIVDPRYSREFYRRLQRYMGGPAESAAPSFRPFYLSWWRDHAGVRAEWLRKHMLASLESQRPIRGLDVLDFGCGTGSSSVVLAEAGARVVGVEPDEISLAVATQRVVDLDYGDRITLIRIPFLTGGAEERLPLEDCTVDVATLIGVLEHMLPKERRHCAAELTRLVKPGGDVFVYDTPNRLFPYDYHTTKLWLVGWMPTRAARWYAIARGRMDRHADFQRRGGVGLLRRDIDDCFPSSQWTCVYEKSVSEVFSEVSAAVQRESGTVGSRLAGGALWAIVRASRLVTLRPSAWTASHVLMYRKRS